MNKRKKRFIFYTHDGAGLGHLTRISRIAKTLASDRVECLVVSGFREMSFIIDRKVKFCKIPSRENMIKERSDYWKIKPFIDIDIPDVYEWRKKDVEAIFDIYKPDAFFIDYYVTGKRGEIKDLVLKHYQDVKFFYLHRGIIGSQHAVNTQVLTTDNIYMLSNYFEKALLANDSDIFDFTKEYDIPERLKEKCISVGYVSHKLDEEKQNRVRNNRGASDKVWIVCTSGGGKLGELFSECVEDLPEIFRDVCFDIVAGPRNSYHIPSNDLDNCTYHQCCESLPDYIASADLCITTGGYNTITEALGNGTDLFIHPSQVELEDEQYFHAIALQKRLSYDNVIKDRSDFKTKITHFIENRQSYKSQKIDMDGAEKVRDIIYSIFKLEI